MACATLTPDKPCIQFSGSLGPAKWELDICLRDLCKITLEGKACFFGSCKSFNITLVSWC